MEHDPVRFTIRDLASAMASAARYQGAAPTLHAFHADRLGALARAFGVTDLEASVRSNDAARMIDSVLELINARLSPFDDFVEASQGINALWQIHGKNLRTAADELRSVNIDLLADLLSLTLGVPRSRTVTAADVAENGWDPDHPEPDPLDHL